LNVQTHSKGFFSQNHDNSKNVLCKSWFKNKFFQKISIVFSIQIFQENIVKTNAHFGQLQHHFHFIFFASEFSCIKFLLQDEKVLKIGSHFSKKISVIFSSLKGLKKEKYSIFTIFSLIKSENFDSNSKDFVH